MSHETRELIIALVLDLLFVILHERAQRRLKSRDWAGGALVGEERRGELLELSVGDLILGRPKANCVHEYMHMPTERERLLAEIAQQPAAVERTLRVPVADARRVLAGRAFLLCRRAWLVRSRRLQRKLFVAAKRQRGRRFHALLDRIARPDILAEAWRRVRRNGGAAGVDGETLAVAEAYGIARLLGELGDELRSGRYRPSPVLRRHIPKAAGGMRPLGIPTVKDRIAQMAAKLVLEPIFEADFLPSSYGYRPCRRALDALEVIREAANTGAECVLDADIADFFGSLDHELLLGLVAKRISDRRVLALIRRWLRAGVMEDGQVRDTVAGVPQGGVISPLLANIYLHTLDLVWERRCRDLGTLVRYADDFVVIARSPEALVESERRVANTLRHLGLRLHPDKTRKLDLANGHSGFEFLGHHLRKRVSGRLLERGVRRYYLQRWPSPRSMRRIRQRVHELTDPRASGVRDVRVLIERLNPALRGWGAYFRTGNAATKFLSIDRYVQDRLRRFLVRRAGRNLRPDRAAQWTAEWFWGHGLHRLRGTVRYPKPCMLDAKTIVKPDEGEPHVRFERGLVETGRARAVPRH